MRLFFASTPYWRVAAVSGCSWPSVPGFFRVPFYIDSRTANIQALHRPSITPVEHFRERKQNRAACNWGKKTAKQSLKQNNSYIIYWEKYILRCTFTGKISCLFAWVKIKFLRGLNLPTPLKSIGASLNLFSDGCQVIKSNEGVKTFISTVPLFATSYLYSSLLVTKSRTCKVLITLFTGSYVSGGSWTL